MACEENPPPTDFTPVPGYGSDDQYAYDPIDTSDSGTTPDAYEYQYPTTPLFEWGGPETGPLPPIPGGCPEEHPVEEGGGCWRGEASDA